MIYSVNQALLAATVETTYICPLIGRLDDIGHKAFENLTMYNKNEILYKKCNFLQSSKTENHQIELLIDSLQHAKPIKIALTNIKKDGTEFFNLLALKPIFNMDGIYSYVIGIQYDITAEESSIKHINMIDDLLSFLPNILR